MLQTDAHSDSVPSSTRLIVVVVLGIAVAYILGALTGAMLTTLVEGSGGWWEETLLRKGPHRLIRRCAMIYGILFLPIFLREIKWQGRHDCGTTDGVNPFFWPTARKHILIGFAMGWTMLALIGVLHYSTGIRILIESKSLGDITLHAMRVSLQCIVVALTEELVFRGILFRCISRAWGPWPTALFLSIVFSVMHLMKPARAAVESGQGIVEMAMAGLLSMFQALPTIPHVELRIINLTLMSVALCAVCLRTRTIWAGVGLHAGWVWIKLVNGYFTNADKTSGWSLWLGNRSDTTDSLLCTVLLSLILIWALRTTPPKATA